MSIIIIVIISCFYILKNIFAINIPPIILALFYAYSKTYVFLFANIMYNNI